MNSRFVHLVAATAFRGRRAYTLHLIDPSMFFHPTAPSHGSTDNVKDMEEFKLDPGIMTFHGPNQLGDLGAMEFMPLGAPDRKGIVAVDQRCRTILFDMATHAISTMPALHAPKVCPVSIPVGDSLYVLKTNAMPCDEHCFEALIYGRGPESRCSPDWYWHSLPPPPHVLAPNDELDKICFCDIISLALLGGTHIWVSTAYAGTYSFSTVAGSWSKVANWKMPFDGRAEYIPELGISLGFSSSDNLLCACDLTGVSLPHPPKLLGKWEDVVQSKEWTPITSELVPLGSGKVFIAKFFETKEKIYIQDDYVNQSKWFAVFAGVELENSDGQLRMRKHKSMRFTPGLRLGHWLI